MNCKNCNVSIPDEASFCPLCGAETGVKTAAGAASKKCPQCGAENPPEAKFCRADGFAFSIAEVESKVVSDVPEKPEAKFCRADGFAFSIAEVESKVVSDVPEKKEIIVPPVAGTPEIKEIVPEKRGRKSLLPWIIVICAVIVLVAAFGAYRFFSKATGDGRIRPEAENAVEATGETSTGKEDKEVDPARLEGQANRALRKEGLSGVTAVVDDSLIVTLRGVVKDPRDKQKAMKIAQSFKEVRQVKDMIFVIEQ